MRFMNEFDMEMAKRRFAHLPVKLKAVRIITDLMNLTNQVSDGWPYWSKPVRSAEKLMVVIEDMEDPTEDDLKKALVPIKTMLTRNAKTFAGRTLNFN